MVRLALHCRERRPMAFVFLLVVAFLSLSSRGDLQLRQCMFRFIFLAQKFPLYGILSHLFGFSLFRFDRTMFGSNFSPDISSSVWICNASSSGFVRMGANVPSPSTSGISSSSSSSSFSSLSLSVLFRFWTIFDFSFKM